MDIYICVYIEDGSIERYSALFQKGLKKLLHARISSILITTLLKYKSRETRKLSLAVIFFKAQL